MNSETLNTFQMVWVGCMALLVLIERSNEDLVFKTKSQLAIAILFSPISLLFLIWNKISPKVTFSIKSKPLDIEELSDVEKKLYSEITNFLSSSENDKDIVNYYKSRKNAYSFELRNFSKKTVQLDSSKFNIQDGEKRMFDVVYHLVVKKDYATFNSPMPYLEVKFKSSHNYVANDISITVTKEGEKMFDVIANKVKNLAEESEKERQKALEIEKNKDLYDLLNNTSHKSNGIVKLK